MIARSTAHDCSRCVAPRVASHAQQALKKNATSRRLDDEDDDVPLMRKTAESQKEAAVATRNVADESDADQSDEVSGRPRHSRRASATGVLVRARACACACICVCVRCAAVSPPSSPRLLSVVAAPPQEEQEQQGLQAGVKMQWVAIGETRMTRWDMARGFVQTAILFLLFFLCVYLRANVATEKALCKSLETAFVDTKLVDFQGSMIDFNNIHSARTWGKWAGESFTNTLFGLTDEDFAATLSGCAIALVSRRSTCCQQMAVPLTTASVLEKS